MNKNIDLNKWFDGRAIVMGILFVTAAHFWNKSQKSNEKFENMIIQNDKALTERTTWMRVTDIRLTVIEKALGIEPLNYKQR